jgi:hypothetical protein
MIPDTQNRHFDSECHDCPAVDVTFTRTPHDARDGPREFAEELSAQAKPVATGCPAGQ